MRTAPAEGGDSPLFADAMPPSRDFDVTTVANSYAEGEDFKLHDSQVKRKLGFNEQ